MIRAALRGLRGRLLLSLVATSAVTLIVAAAITLGPLQSRLRDESDDRAAGHDRGDALASSRRRSARTEPKKGGKPDAKYAEQRARSAAQTRRSR